MRNFLFIFVYQFEYYLVTYSRTIISLLVSVGCHSWPICVLIDKNNNRSIFSLNQKINQSNQSIEKPVGQSLPSIIATRFQCCDLFPWIKCLQLDYALRFTHCLLVCTSSFFLVACCNVAKLDLISLFITCSNSYRYNVFTNNSNCEVRGWRHLGRTLLIRPTPKTTPPKKKNTRIRNPLPINELVLLKTKTRMENQDFHPSKSLMTVEMQKNMNSLFQTHKLTLKPYRIRLNLETKRVHDCLQVGLAT